ncbi:MAG: hypothetical protein Sv326_0426 [Candidatus Fermentimicrarchaeum limneticum]|uniref:Uncharacterized protein n=1 Tax=Fermentimicrarchaeum limneticum TaxID=2795018 RepID=A0A7D5XPH3_FERL1|nr:MAG: hypothetical protein Sv326_0352 [Candidatus Fermentimicrarchaeum limneticum]QLJ52564.1 MAG: hypothetical protein Sv326_0389 [Candidatus Fermentimicrarchaeum limneticum]QLJ52601.1 MAG: hypothetical protein Sv326_0426 [Candidatus Fermentimicrarchaeum limneticum]
MKINMTGKTVGEVEQVLDSLSKAGFVCSVSGSVNETVINAR